MENYKGMEIEIKEFRNKKFYSASYFIPELNTYNTKTGIYKENINKEKIYQELKNHRPIRLDVRYAGKI